MNRVGTQTISHGYEPTVRGFAGIGASLGRVVLRVTDVLLTWQGRAAQRAQLAATEDHLLEDMGLSRADVEREVAKPFWRA